MKIHYRENQGKIEIVRCFGNDPEVALPESIGGKPVVRTAPYAFSARKNMEEEDVLVFETEDQRMFGGGERLLAGEAVESVIFPDTMEEIGNYIFYGCRNLRRLSFSDRLRGVGSGAFTGCRELGSLRVNLTEGKKTCVKEILGDLWQRIDVTFLQGEREIRLVFPEHYEEAVENTPARILFTQHHGSGNNYRQCFYAREMDYRKYDELFYVAKAYDRVNVLSDIAFSRLMYPEDLTEKAEREYEAYIRENENQVLEYLTDAEKMEEMREISRRRLWERDALETAADYAARTGKREILSFLMEEQHRFFPVRRKKFDL
ncbi:hypothetical protein B5F07_09890 [Lachnoclostridium sp. An169]|uniref:leucine-rich repeat protein n=1 Tax=Lachnoclostridium sp. An169 TaxID=1965569 RepID=UPI000B3986C9|nr:leucine-rich repeat protein [Lachnoclostridium sp. An169]OUP83577.1 hypothetical protein B5F07_09890 [Lachnoclostridium sp. An169]HJA66083.1 leucine-rich repeat domain-containing protein [Candidatus Mediterraneibacter cottocaccae]